MLRLLACVGLDLSIAAPTAAAQDFAGQWASSPAGHFAFVPQDELDGRATLRVVNPDGQLAAPEEVARDAFGSPIALSRIEDVAGRRVAILPDGRMIIGWTDHKTNRLEARTRAADGTLGPPRVLTTKLALDSSITALPLGAGAIAWCERRDGVTTVRIAHAAPDGRIGPAREIARTGSRTIGPAFAVSPSGLAMILRPPERARSPIRWTRVQ